MGACYLAGLAVGYWDSLDEIRRQWKAERGALAAWQTITRHTCRGTRRNIEAAARKAAEPQEQQQEDLHTPPARRGEEKAGLNLEERIDR